MKTFYFVRHGETDGNHNKTYQHHDTPLSKKGLQQAKFLGKRFTSLPVANIVTSHMTRARQTAEAIAKETGKDIIESEFFHELLRPTIVRGRSHYDQEVIDVMKKVRELFTSSAERHSDEENFLDLKERALNALRYLENTGENNTVVITHGTFLKMMLSVMMQGEETTPDFFQNINNFCYAMNTGITICELGRWREWREGEWTLLTWNDHAHLG